MRAQDVAVLNPRFGTRCVIFDVPVDATGEIDFHAADEAASLLLFQTRRRNKLRAMPPAAATPRRKSMRSIRRARRAAATTRSGDPPRPTDDPPRRRPQVVQHPTLNYSRWATQGWHELVRAGWRPLYPATADLDLTPKPRKRHNAAAPLTSDHHVMCSGTPTRAPHAVYATALASRGVAKRSNRCRQCDNDLRADRRRRNASRS